MARLLPGAQTKIATQLGVSKQFVSQVLAGKKASVAVWELAAIHAAECEREHLRRSFLKMSKAALVKILMQAI